jgi:hypothetical protein
LAAAAGISLSLFPQHKNWGDRRELLMPRSFHAIRRNDQLSQQTPPVCIFQISRLLIKGLFSFSGCVCVIRHRGGDWNGWLLLPPHPFSFFAFTFDGYDGNVKRWASRVTFFFRNDATVNRATLSTPTHTHTHRQL